MKEHELNALVGIVTDPIKCAYNLSNNKDLNEIQRIIRVFEINKEQDNKHKYFSLKNLVAFKLVLSNN